MVEKLRDLILNDNRLTGPLPEFLAKMPRLKTVNLASNQLSGDLGQSLPVYFSRNNLLEVFDVNNNEISGIISVEWGGIRSLKELGLGGNLFTGDIPEELCQLEQLKRLDLHENRLYTEIPEGMEKLSALKELRLHGNTLIEGDLPENLICVARHKSVFQVLGSEGARAGRRASREGFDGFGHLFWGDGRCSPLV